MPNLVLSHDGEADGDGEEAGTRSAKVRDVTRGWPSGVMVVMSRRVLGGAVRAQRERRVRDVRAKEGRRTWTKVTKGVVVKAIVRRGVRPQRKTL